MSEMEIDSPVDQVSTVASAQSLESTVEELEKVIGELHSKPLDVRLLRRQLMLVRQLGMQDEEQQAVISISEKVALSEGEWIPYLEGAVKALPQPLDLESLVTVLERFTAAEEDYLSFPILMLHLQFILLLAVSAHPQLLPQNEEDSEPVPYPFPTPETPLLGLDQDVIDFLSLNTLSGLIQSVVDRGRAVITQSHLLWNPWCRWELALLESLEGGDKKQKIADMHDFFLARLGTVHANHAETSQQYSTFTSKYSQLEYESRLVAATEASKEPKRLLESEKRYGKTRETWETAIAAATSPSEQANTYKEYLEWELLPAIRPPGTRAVPQTAVLHAELITALYERTLASFSRSSNLLQTLADEATRAYENAQAKAAASAAVVAAYGKPSKANRKRATKAENAAAQADELDRVEKEGYKMQLVAQARAEKETEAKVWYEYAVRMADLEKFDQGTEEDPAAEPQNTATTYIRATRACPQSALLWSRYLFGIERGLRGDARETYAKAIGLGLLLDPEAPVDGFVELALARASYEARLGGDLDIREDEMEAVVINGALDDEFAGEGRVPAVVLSAIKTIKNVWAEGDTQARLEKYIWQWANAFNVDRPLEGQWLGADELWDAAKKSYGNSYRMWLGHVDFLKSDPRKAAEVSVVFRDASQRHTLDWPDAVWEQWLAYERAFGDAKSFGSAQRIVDRERARVEKKRAEEAAEQARAMEAYQAQFQALQVGAAEAQAAEQASGVVAAMEVDPVSEPAPATAAAGVAVAAAPAPELDQIKTNFEPVKRDRENTTVLVTGIVKGTDVEQVENLFKDCGDIRVVQVIPRGDDQTDAAIVEFKERASVPVALTRDKKRIGEHEVDVNLLWRATLFVTNFPPTFDDEQMKKIFSPYGTILQTRWPSRKYADSRRFFYLTFDSPEAAQNSLQLHGRELESGFSLSVLISDPAAKQTRSDAQPEGRTLFVKGLLRDDTQETIEAIFATSGGIKSVSLGKDKNTGEFKCFAFVVLDTVEATQAALSLNNTKRGGRKLQISLAESNRNGKAQSSGARKSQTEALAPSSGLDDVKDRKARTVRLLDLPDGTQEGLLQQALEKITEVKRLEYFANRQEAKAELPSQGAAGALLLRPEPFVFNGVTIRFAAEGAAVPAPTQPKPEVTDALAFAPRAGRKTAKNKLGLGAGHSVAKADKVLDSVTPAPASGDNSQDFFRSLVTAKNKQREGKLEAARAPAKAPNFVHASAAAEASGEHAQPDTSIATESGDRGEKRAMDEDGEQRDGKKVKFANVDV